MPDEQIQLVDHRAEALKRDLEKAPKSFEEVAKVMLANGTDPKYVSMRYGLDLERCERYVANLKQQQEAKRERENSMSNGFEASQDERPAYPA